MKYHPLLIAFAVAGALTLFGCKESHHHDHDHDHAHEHEHGDHEKTAAPAPADTNAVAAADAAKPYPLDTCLVGGGKLGSMGEPVVITHESQVIKFCCESCQPKFEKDPAKYLAKLATASK